MQQSLLSSCSFLCSPCPGLKADYSARLVSLISSRFWAAWSYRLQSRPCCHTIFSPIAVRGCMTASCFDTSRTHIGDSWSGSLITTEQSLRVSPLHLLLLRRAPHSCRAGPHPPLFKPP